MEEEIAENLKKPKESVKKWIFADIMPEHNPDLVTDVCNMKEVQSESIDTILAAELFEHVQYPEIGIKECYRVLKKNGYFIISAPFLFYIHADPYDYQRWTEYKWKEILGKTGFQIEILEPLGGFFTVLVDMIKTLNKTFPKPIRLLGFLFYPLFDLLGRLDNAKFIKKNKILNKYTTGYFIICKKT